jgi:multidrug efflux system membrane fusion protein
VVEGQERLQEGVLVDPRDWQVPVASASAPPTSERQG